MSDNPEVSEQKLAVRRKTASEMLDCSESTVHKLIKEGKLRTCYVGSDLRVTVESLRALTGTSS